MQTGLKRKFIFIQLTKCTQQIFVRGLINSSVSIEHFFVADGTFCVREFKINIDYVTTARRKLFIYRVLRNFIDALCISIIENGSRSLKINQNTDD